MNQRSDRRSRCGMRGAPAAGGPAPAAPVRPADRTGGPSSSGPLRPAPRAMPDAAKPAPPRNESPVAASKPPSFSDRSAPSFAAPRPVPAAETAPRASFKPAPVEEPPMPPEPPDELYDVEM